MTIKKTIFYTGKGGKQDSAINATLTGITKTFDISKDLLKDVLEEAGNIVLDNTLPMTPMDTGDLRKTGKVTTYDAPSGAAVKVSFGDETVDYAVIVHNDAQPKNWTTPGTGPFFLSKGAQMSVGQIRDMLATRFRAILKGK